MEEFVTRAGTSSRQKSRNRKALHNSLQGICNSCRRELEKPSDKALTYDEAAKTIRQLLSTLEKCEAIETQTGLSASYLYSLRHRNDRIFSERIMKSLGFEKRYVFTGKYKSFVRDVQEVLYTIETEGPFRTVRALCMHLEAEGISIPPASLSTTLRRLKQSGQIDYDVKNPHKQKINIRWMANS